MKLLQRYLTMGFTLTLLSACTFGLPADEELIKHFNQNSQKFEQLAETYELLKGVKASSLLHLKRQDFSTEKLESYKNLRFQQRAGIAK